MIRKNISTGCALSFCLLLIFVLYDSIAVSKDDILYLTLYLKNNIHAQKHQEECKASYANWTNPGGGHFIIPINTQVKYMRNYRNGFIIQVMDDSFPEDKRRIYFQYDRGRMGMSISEYMELIASSQPVSLQEFSEIDLKGIREGKVYQGMTKEGVRTALGYPAMHRTPSLEENAWIYWTNRFRTRTVEFDDSGKVAKVR